MATGGRLADRALDATVAGVRRRASCNLRRLVRGSSGTWLSVDQCLQHAVFSSVGSHFTRSTACYCNDLDPRPIP